MRSRPLPGWALKRNRERAAERDEAFHARLGALVGATRADAVWSNRTCQAFCLGCRASALPPVVEMAVDADEPCAACGHAIGAVCTTRQAS